MKQIPLTQGQFAIVDDDDYERVNQYKWFAHFLPNTHSFYAERNFTREDGKQKQIKMSRFIIGALDHLQVDHINHNTLDNRKENLRLVTCQQNTWNRKSNKGKAIPYKGVYRNGNKYVAEIAHDGKNKYLGIFTTMEEASEAYQAAASTIHGEYRYRDECN